MSASKTVCPISRQQFLAEAQDVPVTIGDTPVEAVVKEFSTGSFGWHFGDKVWLKVGDQRVKVQVGLTLTVVASKDAPNTMLPPTIRSELTAAEQRLDRIINPTKAA